MVTMPSVAGTGLLDTHPVPLHSKATCGPSEMVLERNTEIRRGWKIIGEGKRYCPAPLSYMGLLTSRNGL